MKTSFSPKQDRYGHFTTKEHFDLTKKLIYEIQPLPNKAKKEQIQSITQHLKFSMDNHKASLPGLFTSLDTQNFIEELRMSTLGQQNEKLYGVDGLVDKTRNSKTVSKNNSTQSLKGKSKPRSQIREISITKKQQQQDFLSKQVSTKSLNNFP